MFTDKLKYSTASF